jgi:hypothetical protein
LQKNKRLIPSVSFPGNVDPYKAAAMTLGHFKRLGYDITVEGAHCSIDLPDGTEQTVWVREVLPWLRSSEGNITVLVDAHKSAPQNWPATGRNQTALGGKRDVRSAANARNLNGQGRLVPLRSIS